MTAAANRSHDRELERKMDDMRADLESAAAAAVEAAHKPLLMHAQASAPAAVQALQRPLVTPRPAGVGSVHAGFRSPFRSMQPRPAVSAVACSPTIVKSTAADTAASERTSNKVSAPQHPLRTSAATSALKRKFVPPLKGAASYRLKQ